MKASRNYLYPRELAIEQPPVRTTNDPTRRGKARRLQREKKKTMETAKQLEKLACYKKQVHSEVVNFWCNHHSQIADNCIASIKSASNAKKIE
jgi:ribosomal protein L9